MDICPDFVTPTSRKRFFGQSSEPVWEPEFGTFRGSKVVLAGSKNDHFLIIFVFFSCSDPKFGTFRGSKAVLAVPIRIGTSGHLPCGCNCPKGILCREPKENHVCVFVRPSVRSFVRNTHFGTSKVQI